MRKRDIIKGIFWMVLALAVTGLLVPVEIDFFTNTENDDNQIGRIGSIIIGVVLILFSVTLVTIMSVPFWGLFRKYFVRLKKRLIK